MALIPLTLLAKFFHRVGAGRLFATDYSTAAATIRLVLGVVFFAHGAQKMLGWFGGFGFSGTMRFC
jgi:uncharacterized membrane protein YphA (DoxX/SURF4 family)